MSDDLPKSALYGELIFLQKDLEKVLNSTRCPKDLQEWAKRFNRFSRKIREEKIPVSLSGHLKIKGDKLPIDSTTVPTWWMAYTVENNYFTKAELAARFRVSPQAVLNRLKKPAGKGEFYSTLEASKRKEKEEAKKPIDLTAMSPIDVYGASMRVLGDIIEGDEANSEEKRKVAETVLRHVEPRVLLALKDKFETLDSLGTWILTGLIPKANTLIRQLIRDVEARIKAGENTKFISFDLRTIFRDLLPSFPELKAKIKEQNWGDFNGEAENQEEESDETRTPGKKGEKVAVGV